MSHNLNPLKKFKNQVHNKYKRNSPMINNGKNKKVFNWSNPKNPDNKMFKLSLKKSKSNRFNLKNLNKFWHTPMTSLFFLYSNKSKPFLLKFNKTSKKPWNNFKNVNNISKKWIKTKVVSSLFLNLNIKLKINNNKMMKDQGIVIIIKNKSSSPK
jgi:hypothetical protein